MSKICRHYVHVILILGPLWLHTKKCEEFLLLKSREKKVLEEVCANSKVSEETAASYQEGYKVSFNAFSFLLF